jgi:glycosyltransferase involved in cell wall biosynthesis
MSHREIMLPKLSVVISAYNAELYIKECMDSILNQSFNDFELLIFNDGSLDSTSEIISSYKDHRIKLTDSKINKGVVYWANVGLRMAKGKYILRFDADDINYIDRFQKQWDYMESNPEIGVSSSFIEMLYSNEIILKPIHDIDMRWWLFRGTPLVQGSVIIRTSVLKKNNIFYDEEYKSAEDAELWFQLAKVTRMGNIAEPLFKYRSHDYQESTANIQRQNFYRDKSLYSFFEWLGLPNRENNLIFANNLFSDLLPYTSENTIKVNNFFRALKTPNALSFFGHAEIKKKQIEIINRFVTNLLDFHPRLLLLNPFVLFSALESSLFKISVFYLKCILFWKTREK